MREGRPTRVAYGETLVKLGEENPHIVALDADLSKSTMTVLFAQRFPERFFEMGIAEQNMVGVAAGLATCGKIPFLSTFAAFVPGRAFDQLRMAVVYSQTNVKICSSHSGLTVGEDGVSHQATEDVALARAMPGLAIMVPADEVATVWAVRAAAEHRGPVYLRLGRPPCPILYQQPVAFAWGKAVPWGEGRDATIIANGRLLYEALQAADACRAKGIYCRVLDMHMVEPLDKEAVIRAAEEAGALVVAEEHLLTGGMGSAVAQVVAENRPVPIEFVAIRQTYGQSGKPMELLERYGLTAPHIAAAVERVVTRKREARGA